MVSCTLGSTTSTFWKRRDRAASFSKMPRYSVKVVAPMHLSAPELKRRLEQVGRVQRAARCRAGADQRVDLVDEQDGVGLVLERLEHALEALLEIAAVLGAGQQRAHVQRVHVGLGQDLGHFLLDDAPGQALGDGGLAHAGLTDQQRVVLAAAAQDLDHALDLVLAADQRIDLAVLGGLVQVLGELLQRRSLFVLLAALFAFAGSRIRRPWSARADRSS